MTAANFGSEPIDSEWGIRGHLSELDGAVFVGALQGR